MAYLHAKKYLKKMAKLFPSQLTREITLFILQGIKGMLFRSNKTVAPDLYLFPKDLN